MRMRIPRIKKFGVPIFLNKSEKYSTDSIILIFHLILSKKDGEGKALSDSW